LAPFRFAPVVIFALAWLNINTNFGLPLIRRAKRFVLSKMNRHFIRSGTISNAFELSEKQSEGISVDDVTCALNS
jgi:hypothetical protein